LNSFLTKGNKFIRIKKTLVLLVIIAGLIVMTLLLWPKIASEAPLGAPEYQWSDNVLIALNDPVTPQTAIREYLSNDSIVKERQINTYREIYEYFIEQSQYHGIDTGFVNCLIINESGWNPEAKNPSSTAYGLGQFLNSTWDSTAIRMNRQLNRKNPYDQIDAFLWLFKEDGSGHWVIADKCL